MVEDNTEEDVVEEKKPSIFEKFFTYLILLSSTVAMIYGLYMIADQYRGESSLIVYLVEVGMNDVVNKLFWNNYWIILLLFGIFIKFAQMTYWTSFDNKFLKAIFSPVETFKQIKAEKEMKKNNNLNNL